MVFHTLALFVSTLVFAGCGGAASPADAAQRRRSSWSDRDEQESIMHANRQLEEELTFRIQADVQAFNGNLLERYSLGWHGYLAGLVKWRIIDLALYCRLPTLPPVQEPNPILAIFTGREEPA